MTGTPRRARWLVALMLLATLALLLSLDVAARPAAPPPPPPAPPLPAPSALGPPQVQSKNDATASKIAPQLHDAIQAAADPETVLPVLVVSRGPFQHEALAHAVGRQPNATGLVFTSGQAQAGQIAALAADPQVVTVLSNAAPAPPGLPGFEQPRVRPDLHGQRPVPLLPSEPLPRPTAGGVRGQGLGVSNLPLDPQGLQQPSAKNPQPLSSNPQPPAGPDSWHTVDVQNVRPAWQAGYRGDGVTVAVVDTGVDFGHPDLRGTTARVTDPTSRYYGWPLAFDPHSLWLYANGIVGDWANAVFGYGSWYIDTSTLVTGEQARIATLRASAAGLRPTDHEYILPDTSVSGVYRVGIFPDEHLAFDVYGEYPAVLLADTHIAGHYDTVYVDLNDNYDFRDDETQYKGHEVASRDLNGDGIADISAGMLYYIADGVTPLPASDWMYGLLPPGNGDIVAMMGSYNYGEYHGTPCASSVVAQGIVDGLNPLRPPWKPSGSGGMVQGTAPHAKVLAIGDVYRSDQSFYAAYDFITFGLDGRPNTGDEPQIVSMSYGSSGNADNGWDFQSRYLTLLSQISPQTSWLGATGNGGPGYGTITSPAASNTVIGVGAATQYGENTTFDPISGTNEITWGDVQPWSNRGPSHLGKAGPDVVAVGAWGTGDVPLNSALTIDGSQAYALWGGTSMATPTAAGVLALIYQAYHQAHGVWPTREEARALLMSSATDLGYGPFVQGAGLANGARGVDLARGVAGLEVSPPAWIPGQQYLGATGVVTPGTTSTQVFTLTNPTNAPIVASMSADQLVELNHIDWTQAVSNSRESPVDTLRPDYLYDLTRFIPANADLIKITAVIPYNQFSGSPPTSTLLLWQNALNVVAYGWRDKNHDGHVWIDANANGVVNDGEYQVGELNRLSYGYPKQTLWETYVGDPHARIHDGLLIGLVHYIRDGTIPQSSVRLRATFYRHVPWAPASVSPPAVTVPAHGSAGVTASVSVPLTQAAGTVEGALTVAYGNDTTVVPVTLNVPAAGLPVTFGGTPPSGAPFDAGRTSGQVDWGWRPETGDWRHFYFNSTLSPGPYTYFWARADWLSVPTDKDIIVLGNAPWDYFSGTAPGVFGPFGMGWIGSTRSLNVGGGAWQWATQTGTHQEWAWGRLAQPGLHEMVLHDTFYSGADFSEPFTATLGTVDIQPGDITITSSNLQDRAVFTVTTAMPLPGLAATTYGLSQQNRFTNIPIQNYGTWIYTMTLTSTASLAVSTDSADQFNLYIYLERWNGTRWQWIASSGGSGAAQYLNVAPVADGDYRLRVAAGYIAPPGTHNFNLTFQAIHGRDTFVAPAAITTPIPAGTTVTFTVGYSRTQMAPGIYNGTLFLGPYGAPRLMSFPITVYYGNPPPFPTPTPGTCRFPFVDVLPDYWAYSYIGWIYCNNIVTGYFDNTFRPDALTSRAQFLKMLALVNGWGAVTPASPTFADVPPHFWSYGYIEAAAAHGIITGHACGGPGELCDAQNRPYLRPVAAVSRAQVVKMIVLSRGWLTPPGPGTPTPPPTPGTAFADVPPGHWAYDFVQAAVARGVISGYANNTFLPNSLISRAQMAKMIYQMAQH